MLQCFCIWKTKKDHNSLVKIGICKADQLGYDSELHINYSLVIEIASDIAFEVFDYVLNEYKEFKIPDTDEYKHDVRYNMQELIHNKFGNDCINVILKSRRFGGRERVYVKNSANVLKDLAVINKQRQM